MPPEMAEPYREALTKLQTAAPPMPAARTHRVLAEQFGRGWRDRFREFDDTPAAAASIGQVHRAVWHDGRDVAVKVQYPGAEEAVMADLRQLQRFSRMVQPLVPGMEIKPLLSELRDRMAEELDYRDEADAQRAFAAAYEGDEHVVVPRVVASAPKAMVSEWVTGTPLSAIIRSGEPEERDRVGLLLSRFHFSSPARVGLLHADPHPGNFQLLPDGRLCVIDFGAVAKLPDGLPRELGHMLRLAVEDRSDELLELLQAAELRAARRRHGRRTRRSPTSARSPTRCAPRSSTSRGRGCAGRPTASATCAAPSSPPAAGSTCRRSTCWCTA